MGVEYIDGVSPARLDLDNLGMTCAPLRWRIVPSLFVIRSARDVVIRKKLCREHYRPRRSMGGRSRSTLLHRLEIQEYTGSADMLGS
jgi:hypothetical protein